MTRREAIIFLENISVFQQPDGNYRKALDFAIKALEQEPKFIVKSDGTIEQIKTEQYDRRYKHEQ